MSDRGLQCPFINRADSRCSHNFTLDRLDQAFELCFNSYHACPVFVELLAERRIRREGDNALSITARNAAHAAAVAAISARQQLVQVKVAAGYAKQTA
jgi:hypothetical protein